MHEHIYIKRWFLNNPLRNYNYLIVNPENKHCLIVDPTMVEHYTQYIDQHQLIPEAILLTHHHTDHIAGVDKLVERYNCPSYGNFDHTRKGQITHKVQNHEKLHFQTVSEIEVIFSPGHISSHVCFYLPKEKALFCGDTIFTAGIGHVNDPSADIDVFYQSIQYLKTLPGDTKLYTAHDYFEKNLSFAMSIDPDNANYRKWHDKVKGVLAEDKPVTSIQDEHEMNIFFHADSSALKNRLSEKQKHLTSSEAVFCYLRAQKDVF
ncbi:hydroxyacylglutathione hydrolase [Fangia hongkongensis]|uniref:hydroxyacylglutathione hydrolase n=1 Tax=Fangia hongkongensis TaxID=270495 RepID=UPI000381E609|nr:hydroxyacylglutathione hydrolase [Fangia hongkongensis]MBK2124537.1 hydroxyacylglutathione hydrolase [Fangia hongkongensis]